jgi:hypothetical protein
MNQTSPWGPLNPNRGVKYLAMAQTWLAQFPPAERKITLTEIDAYLIQHDHMPATATARERGAYRHEFLDKLRSASTSPQLRDLGLSPFEILCGHGYWMTVSLGQYVRRRKESRKLRTQAHTSLLKLRRIQQALDPTLDQRAYLYATMSGKVLDIGVQVMNTLDEQLSKGLQDMGLIFDRTERLLGQGGDAAGAA